MHIAVGQFYHETNTFSSQTTDLDSFKRSDYSVREGLVEKYAGTRHFLGGIIEGLRGEGADIVPLLSASTTPSGLITRQAYDEIKADLLARLRQAHPVDGVCLALHGASAVEGIDDPEGDLLSEIRRLVGHAVPVVATLDLHANVSAMMVEEADGLFGVNYYPHTDQFERGVEAARFTTRVIKGEIRPVMSLQTLPMLTPSSKQFSHAGAAQEMNSLAWEVEAKPGILDCNIFWAFPFADSPLARMSVLAIADGDRERAEEACQLVARAIWTRREEFRYDDPTPEEAVSEALAASAHPVVIAEASDNPGGGATGDSTSLLGALLAARAGTQGPVCFGVLVDAGVVEMACQSGPGAVINALLGGKTDRLHGKPLAVRAYVKALSDGRFRLTNPMLTGVTVEMGRMAHLVIDGIDVLVSERREQIFDQEVFRLHGIDVGTYRIVGLKSALHFRAAFDVVASKTIIVGGDGITSGDLAKYPYTRLIRPMWPLDKSVPFEV